MNNTIFSFIIVLINVDIYGITFPALKVLKTKKFIKNRDEKNKDVFNNIKKNHPPFLLYLSLYCNPSAYGLRLAKWRAQ